MIVCVREYATAKGLESAVKYHGLDVLDIEICRRILKSLSPVFHFVCEGFALRVGYSLIDFDQAIIHSEEL